MLATTTKGISTKLETTVTTTTILPAETQTATPIATTSRTIGTSAAIVTSTATPTTSAATPAIRRTSTTTPPSPSPSPLTRGETAATTRTTITSDPGILCFHHCNVKVFCFTLPHICPNCKAELHNGCSGSGNGSGNGKCNGNSTINSGKGNRNSDADSIVTANKQRKDDEIDNDDEDDNNDDAESDDYDERNGDNDDVRSRNILMKLLPFRLPYPFVRAAQYPCAIVLRPTTGDFLNDYNNATDLHIAVTTSTGCIVEFDRYGLRRHRTTVADNMPEWWQCLLVGDVPEPWYDYWDDILMQICKQPACWSIAHYNEDTHNCYTFVLAFLQALAYGKLSEAATSKTTFCERYIVPRTTTAGKYISLYRKLRDVGIYVHPHHQQQHHSQKQSQQQHPQQHQHQHQQRQYRNGNTHSTYTAPTVPRTFIATVPTTSYSAAVQQQQYPLQQHQHQHLQVTAKTSGKTKMKSSAFSITTRTSSLCTIEE